MRLPLGTRGACCICIPISRIMQPLLISDEQRLYPNQQRTNVENRDGSKSPCHHPDR